ncbi:MAG: hypothetical protein GY868_18725, partial [Deltaproteobacteria bacterium]|nr:hypothetical protein [Deltaproteobacteria bacterium]
KGKGPSIVETHTYRYKGHFEGDRQAYRGKDEIESYRKEFDPIDTFEALLVEEGSITKKQLTTIHNEIHEIIAAAVQFGVDAPAPKPEDALDDLFVNA